jgi:ATP-binding cassette subfamily F protein 3
VALAKTLISEANFLLLDEPTNHLDMQSVNILIQALDQYEGTFVVISHDRYFVENVANKIWYIEDYVLKEYPGTYHEYEYWMEQREKGLKRPIPQATPAKAQPKPKPTASQQQELEQELKRINQKLKQVEGLVNDLEGKLKSCESKLALPSTYADPNALHETTQQFNKIKTQLDKEQSAWEQLMEQVDELETQLK